MTSILVRAMRLVSLFVLILAGACLCKGEATERRQWGLAVSSCGGSKGLDFGIFERDGDVLMAEANYLNLAEKTPQAKKAEIGGATLPDGSFWPTATLQVSHDSKGPWHTIGTSSRSGVPRVQTIAAGDHALRLHFDLSPFIPMLGTPQFGRVVISTGDAATIAFSFLKP